MSQIDNVNESKDSLPRIPLLSQSIEIKLTTRSATVIVSFKLCSYVYGMTPNPKRSTLMHL